MDKDLFDMAIAFLLGCSIGLNIVLIDRIFNFWYVNLIPFFYLLVLIVMIYKLKRQGR